MTFEVLGAANGVVVRRGLALALAVLASQALDQHLDEVQARLQHRPWAVVSLLRDPAYPRDYFQVVLRANGADQSFALDRGLPMTATLRTPGPGQEYHHTYFAPPGRYAVEAVSPTGAPIHVGDVEIEDGLKAWFDLALPETPETLELSLQSSDGAAPADVALRQRSIEGTWSRWYSISDWPTFGEKAPALRVKLEGGQPTVVQLVAPGCHPVSLICRGHAAHVFLPVAALSAPVHPTLSLDGNWTRAALLPEELLSGAPNDWLLARVAAVSAQSVAEKGLPIIGRPPFRAFLWWDDGFRTVSQHLWLDDRVQLVRRP